MLYAPEINLEVVVGGVFALVGGIVLLRGGWRPVPEGNEHTLLQRYSGTILAGDQPLPLEVHCLANGAYRVTVGDKIVAQGTPIFAPKEVRFEVGSPPVAATAVLRDARKRGRTHMTVLVGAKRYSLPLA